MTERAFGGDGGSFNVSSSVPSASASDPYSFLEQQDRIRGRLRRAITGEGLFGLPPVTSDSNLTSSPSANTSSSSISELSGGDGPSMQSPSIFPSGTSPAAPSLEPSLIDSSSTPSSSNIPTNTNTCMKRTQSFGELQSSTTEKERGPSISIRMPNEPKPSPLPDFGLLDPLSHPGPSAASAKAAELQKRELELELQNQFRQHWEEDEFFAPPPKTVQVSAPRGVVPRAKTTEVTMSLQEPSVSSPKPERGTTPLKRRTLADLWDIVKSNNREELLHLMECVGDSAVVTATNQFLQTALHIAAEKGLIDVAVVLVAHGAEVNAKDKNGWTALHSAAHSGSWAVCELLLRQSETSVMVISSSGATPLHYLIKCPLSDATERTPGYAQSVAAFKRIFNLMIAKGAIVNAQNNFGETPLHQAASLPSAVVCLLENGASLSLRSITGETPLHYACRGGNEKSVQALLEYGADPSISGHQGTPLDIARAMKLNSIVKLLNSKLNELRRTGTGKSAASHNPNKPQHREVDFSSSVVQPATNVDEAARARLKKGQTFRVQSHGFLLWNNELIDVMLRQSGRSVLRTVAMNKLPVKLEVVRHMFNIRADETFIEHFACNLNGSNRGMLLVFQHLVCFYSTTSSGGIESKEIIAFKDIVGIFRVGEDGLELTTNKRFLFRHFEANCQEIFSLLEFLRSCRERVGPIVMEGFPIHQMLGAIKNPYDYRELRERSHDTRRQSLAACCSCTIQIFDESEGMLDVPENGKLFVSQGNLIFLSSSHGSRRTRDISFGTIKEVIPQKATGTPSKIQLVGAGLRYSFTNFPSEYYYEKILVTIQTIWASTQKWIHLQSILVLGADTLIGLLVIKELTAVACVRAAVDVQEPATSPAIERIQTLGAELVRVDFTDPESIQRALTGVSRVFWVPSREDEIIWQTLTFLEHARAAKVQMIVKVSSLRAHDEDGLVDKTMLENICKNASAKLANLHAKQQPVDNRGKPIGSAEVVTVNLSADRQAEALLESSGIPCVFLRCNMVMQHFACLPIKSQGVFHFPLGKAAVSWVDTRDLAFAAATVLVADDDIHNGKRYLLTGRESLTCDETADILARVIAKRVQYIDVGEEEVRKSMVMSGVQNVPNLNNVLATYTLAREGKAKEVSDHVKQIIGQEPFTFEQFVNDHISFFKDLNRLYFSQKEQEALKAQFHTIDLTRTGSVNRTQFCNSLGYMMCEIGLSDLIFNAFDYRRDELLNLKEYFSGMSVMMKGTVEEKLEFAFKMHDVNHDGYLTREEFQAVADRIKSIGVHCEEVEGMTKFVLDYIFRELVDGEMRPVTKVTREEWKERALKNLRHLQSIGLLTTQLLSREATGKERVVAFGHESWEFVFNILLCISRSVTEIMNEPYQEVFEPSDFEAETSVALSDSGEDATAWIVTDYASRVFRQIRYLFGIDDSSFLASCGIGRTIASMLLGDLTTPQEGASSGRSGSYFFKTEDKKYFIKTIAPEEDSVFRKVLPSYLEYVYRNPNTLLTRFLGLYKIKKGQSGKEYSFVVMTNVFDNNIEIDEQYDLKGSTVGRHVNVEDDKDIAEIALKDMNFKRKICLGPERKAQLMEQVERDCKWMEGHSICDYSLLIGFSFLTGEGDENTPSTGPGTPSTPLVVSGSMGSLTTAIPAAAPFRKESIFKQHRGGILSTDKKVIYFIGIIDNITPYNYKKMGEYLFKRLLHDKNKISAIPPDRYRARFQQYVASIVE